METAAAADEMLPRLRPELVIRPYGTDGDGRTLHVAASDAAACLVSDDSARILRALAARPANIDALLATLATDAPGASQPSRDRVLRFVHEQIPAGLREGADVPPPRTPMLLRRRLLGPAASARAARLLTFLFHPWIAMVVAPAAILLAVAGTARAFDPALRASPGSALGVAGLLLLSALAHELGHVSATAAFGARPGEIGVGIYFIFPVFYADVSRSWQLPRLQRLVVSAGGFYFQLILMAVATLVSVATSSRVAAWLVFMNALAIVHMLNPAFKMDGYWLLSDAARIPNLHARVGATMRRYARRLLLRPAGDVASVEDAAAATLDGRRQGVIIIYAVGSALYFSIIGQQLWGATLGIAGAPSAFADSLAFVASRIATAPTITIQLSRVAELLYLVGRPLLLAIGWVFLTAQAMRLLGLGAARRASAPPLVQVSR